jgi:hypothetical protein
VKFFAVRRQTLCFFHQAVHEDALLLLLSFRVFALFRYAELQAHHGRFFAKQEGFPELPIVQKLIPDYWIVIMKAGHQLIPAGKK